MPERSGRRGEEKTAISHTRAELVVSFFAKGAITASLSGLSIAEKMVT